MAFWILVKWGSVRALLTLAEQYHIYKTFLNTLAVLRQWLWVCLKLITYSFPSATGYLDLFASHCTYLLWSARCWQTLNRGWGRLVKNVIEKFSFCMTFSVILLDKHKLDLCSETSGCFNASLILASWLCVMPTMASGFCFNCSLSGLHLCIRTRAGFIHVTELSRQSVFKCSAFKEAVTWTANVAG